MAQIDYDVERDYSCTRCGQPVPGTTLAKRQWRGSDNTQCGDCNATPVVAVAKCRPWSGDFDFDTMQCLKDGKPYKIGERTCGNYDCVAEAHIIRAAEKKKTYRARAVGWSFDEAYAQVMAHQFATRNRRGKSTRIVATNIEGQTA